MRDIRILFINRWVGCHTGGTETHIKEVASRLAQKGHEVNIMTTEGNELKRFEPSIKTYYISKNRWEPSYVRPLDIWLLYFGLLSGIKYFIKLLQLRISGIKFDVISVHCTLEAMLMLPYRLFLNVPVVFIFEGYTDMEAKIAKYTDLQIAMSKPVINKCNIRCGYEPILIPIGVDMKRFTPNGRKLAITEKDNKIVVLSVCRLAKYKNVNVLIEAANIVCQRHPDFIFQIVGDGPERKNLEMLVERYNLKDNVSIYGKVSADDLPMYYRSADIFVTMQVSPDQFWIVVLEALASRTPVIWTYDGTDDDLESIENWGIPVPPNNPEILAQNIIRLGIDMKFYNENKQASLIKAKNYDWDRIISLYERAYESVVNQHAR